MKGVHLLNRAAKEGDAIQREPNQSGPHVWQIELFKFWCVNNLMKLFPANAWRLVPVWGLAGEGPTEGYKSEGGAPSAESSTESLLLSHKATMFSKRILSFFLLLVSFGLFAYAKPISDDAVAIRSLLKDAPTDLVERLERRGGFPEKPCRKTQYALWIATSVAYSELDCDKDLEDVVVTLKESISVEVEEFGEHE